MSTPTIKLDKVTGIGGDTVDFSKSTVSPYHFNAKLRLHTGEKRNIGVLKIPKYEGKSVIFEVNRTNYEHYMRKVGGYGFNYALMEYLVKRFPRNRVMVSLHETDTGETFMVDVRAMMGKRSSGYLDKGMELVPVEPGSKQAAETVLRFKDQGFELQVFRKTAEYVADTKEYLKYLDSIS